MQVRALVLEKFGEPLKLTSFNIPEPREGEILAKVNAAGICGSDLHILQGLDPRTPLPIIPGHEGVGEVVQPGAGAADIDGRPLKPGDAIVWERSITCGKCYFCNKGEEYLCTSRKVYGINITSADPPHLSGNYADHILLRKGTRIFPMSPNEDPASIVPITCSGATAAHAHRKAAIQTGDSVIIFGAGPIAMFQAAFAKWAGASKVIVITIRKGPKASLIAKFGADDVMTHTETDAVERRDKIAGITYGMGADVAIDTTPDPSVFHEAVSLLRRGGTYMNSGASIPVPEIPIEIYSHIVNKAITIRGIWAGDASHLKMALELYRYTTFPFHEIITHKFALEDHEKAWDILKNREGIKIVFTPWV